MYRTRALAIALSSASAICAASISLPTSLCDAAAQLSIVKNTGLTSPEGPACDSAGNLYFTDHRSFSHTSAVIWKAPADGSTPVLYKQNLDVACGIVFDRNSRMIYSGWNGVWRIDNLSTPATVTTLASGDSLNEANDITLCADGGMFFTGNLWDAQSFVYYRSASGALKKALTLPGAPNACFPNGIEYIEEKQRIYLSLSQKDTVRTYRVDAQMNLVSPATFARVRGGDGIAIDANGNVWVASSMDNKIAVFDSVGTSIGSINLDWGATNCAFGGPNSRMLYITGGTAVLKLQLKISGRPTTGGTSIGNPSIRRGSAQEPARQGRSSDPRAYRVSGQLVPADCAAQTVSVGAAGNIRLPQ